MKTTRQLKIKIFFLSKYKQSCVYPLFYNIKYVLLEYGLLKHKNPLRNEKVEIFKLFIGQHSLIIKK